MQFSRNRRILWAQDIVLICLIPLLCFFSLGSLGIGGWNMGATYTWDPNATEIAEECLADFYVSYTNADGDELGDTVSFSPVGIWKNVATGITELSAGISEGRVALDDLNQMPEDLFDDCAGLLFMLHVVSYTTSNTISQGLIYTVLFGYTALIPLIGLIQLVCALIGLLTRRKDSRKRHRCAVLCFRRTVLPLFVILFLTLTLPDVTPSAVWFYGMGLFLLCVIWNLVASRVKRNTGNEKEFLNFIQIFSILGVISAVGALAALERSHIPAYLYDRIRYADGLEIILACFEGDFDVPKLLMLIFIAVFLTGIGLAVRYLYYGFLRIACLMESTRHKKVEKEGLIAPVVFAILTLASSYFLFEASGRLKLVVEESEMVTFFVALGLLALVLVLEIIQRILCYLNRLDREYRNDLLCGRTDDRMYSIEAVIAEVEEPAPIEETAMVEAAMVEAPVGEVSAAEASITDGFAEEASAEEASASETPATETIVVPSSADALPSEDSDT